MGVSLTRTSRKIPPPTPVRVARIPEVMALSFKSVPALAPIRAKTAKPMESKTKLVVVKKSSICFSMGLSFFLVRTKRYIIRATAADK